MSQHGPAHKMLSSMNRKQILFITDYVTKSIGFDLSEINLVIIALLLELI